MAYSNIDKPSDYFETITYTGNGSTLSISSLDFSPDWVWIKNRDIVSNNLLFDTVRGATLSLESESTAAETARSGITSFDSNGFTLGSNGNSNASGNSHVAWSWRGSDSSAVSNTDGDITSQVSANTTSGFSIVSYTGNGTAGATVGHGLGVAPAMIIVKKRNVAEDWIAYHKSLTATNYIKLNLTDQTFANTVVWNDTEPTSSDFTIGTSGAVNTSSATYIAYCFSEVKGYSKFGSYTGNGSTDGTFVYTGFKPAMIIVKRTDTTGSWVIYDNKRDTFNPADAQLVPSSSEAEATSERFDFLSNGFKLITTATRVNASGGTYIYMAFAENPLVGTNNIPATAR